MAVRSVERGCPVWEGAWSWPGVSVTAPANWRGRRAGTRWREREARLLAEAARLFHASLALDEVRAWVVEFVVEELGDVACLFLYDERAGGEAPRLELAASAFATAALGQRWRESGALAPPWPWAGALAEALRTGELVFLADALADPRMDSGRAALLGIRSWIGVPLLGPDGPLGVLTIASGGGARGRRRTLGARDRRSIVEIAQHAATALDNARRYEQARWREREATLLAEASRRFNASLELPATLAAVAELAGRAMADVCGLFLTEPEQPELTLAAYYHPNPDERDRQRAILLADPPRRGRGPLGALANGGPPVLLREAGVAPTTPRHDVERLDLATWLGVPLRAHEQVLGVLMLGTLTAGRILDERDLALAEALAERAAAAIQHARLLEDRRRGELLQGTIVALAREVGSALEPDDVARRLARALPNYFAFSVASVFLVDHTRRDVALRGFVSHAGHHRPLDGSLRLPFGVGIVGWVAEHGEALLVPDVTVDPRYVAFDAPDRLATRSELAVPILGARGALGVINLESEHPNAFTTSDLYLVWAVARQATVALENAWLHSATRQAAADLRAVLESVEQGVVMTDQAGRIRFANRRAGELLGLDVGAVVGRTTLEVAEQLIQWRLREPTEYLARLTWLAAHPEESATDEVVFAAPVARILERYSGPVRDPEGGQRLGRLEVYSDVTEARRLDRAKDEFLATASHELKTPITTLGGYLELLRRQLQRPDGPDLARLTSYVETALRELDRLRRLSEDLLEVARIEAGRLTMRAEPLDLGALVGEAVERFARPATLHQSERRFVYRAPAALPVRGDPLRLGQVLSNLLENALKYSPAGSEVLVTAERRAGEAVVGVRDAGVGIPVHERERLFLPFYRAANASLGSAEGLGLGLYISRGIVEAHGGRLWIETAPGGGSIFLVALPLNEC